MLEKANRRQEGNTNGMDEKISELESVWPDTADIDRVVALR
jgi:hypothetical protein